MISRAFKNDTEAIVAIVNCVPENDQNHRKPPIAAYRQCIANTPPMVKNHEK